MELDQGKFGFIDFEPEAEIGRDMMKAIKLKVKLYSQERMKPRIKKSNGTWFCRCSRFHGSGINPVVAYWDWRLNGRNHENAGTAVKLVNSVET